MAKLNAEDAERVLTSVRQHLPPQVTVRLTGRGTLLVKSKPKRSEWAGSSSNAFGHLSKRTRRDKAITLAMREVLNMVTFHLRDNGGQWPGLDYGPVVTKTWTDGATVLATVTDRHGAVLHFPPVLAADGQTPD